MCKAVKVCRKLAAWFPPLHFLGFSFFYVWDFVLDNSVLPETGISVVKGVFDAAIELVVLLVFAMLWRQMSSPSGRKVAIWAISAAGIVCTLVTFGAFSGLSGSGASCVAVVLRAVFSLGTFVLWCGLFGLISFANVVKVVALSFVAAPLVDLVISLLPSDAYFGMALLLPLLGAQCLLRSHAALDAERGVCSAEPNRLSPSCKGSAFLPFKKSGADFALFPWEIVLVGVTLPFVSNMVKFGDSFNVDVLSFGAAGVVTLVLFIAFRKKFGVFSLINIQFPLLLMGLLAASLFGWLLPDAAQAFIRASGALRLIFIFIVVSDRSFRFGLSAVFFASVFRALGIVAGQIGFAIRELTAPLQFDPLAQEAVLYFLGILVVVVVLVVWFRTPFASLGDAVKEGADALPDDLCAHTNDGVVSTGSERLPIAGGRESGVGAIMADDSDFEEQLDAYRLLVAKRCAELSSECLLSARESEILLLLARGLSVSRIEKELVISGNTVKTHVRHIYRKLGIHSRDELQILIGID